MSILLFFAVLFVLILVHEWGHFFVAKKMDMQVDEFGIGFPPKLFGIKKGETEYSLNALPIGGFVRIYGEDALGEDGESVAGVGRSFVSKSKLAQAAVLIAGVTMNVIFAWFLFVAVFAMGVPTAVDESEATEAATLAVTSVLPGSPAAEAEIPVGAKIVGLSTESDNLQNLTPQAFSDFTQAHSNEPIAVTYSVSDTEFTTLLTPATDLITDNPDQPAIGVALVLVEIVREPIHQALITAATVTGTSLWAITTGLVDLIAGAFTGSADLSQVAGPIGIAGMVGDAADFGLTSLLMFTAIISLNLAVINLLPFPALDGGRLLFVAVEAVTRKPINPVWVMRLNTIGFGLLLLLMIAVTYSDIVKII